MAVTNITDLKIFMKIKQQILLVLAVSLCLLSMSAYALAPDTLSKTEAIAMAKQQQKMIFLFVSDTNSCSACILMEYGTLPSPAVSSFLGESFIYWACGPEQQCTDFVTYTGGGSIPLPTYFIIDPYRPETYAAFGSGGADTGAFMNWLRLGLMKSTAPKILSPQQDQNYTSANVPMSITSISTNVPIHTVIYKLNEDNWISAPVSYAQQNWQTNLQVRLGSNTLKVSAIGPYGYARTNTVTFTYTIKSDLEITVVSSKNPSSFGQGVTFTANLSVTGAAPTGSLQFKTNNVNFGPAVTLTGTTANSALVSTLPVGNTTVTAEYAGDANYNARTGTLTGGQQVNKADLAIEVKSSLNPSALGQTVTFTATVTASGAATPTGTVQFKTNNVDFGSPVALSGAPASMSSSNLPVGNTPVTAYYSGDGNFNSITGTLSGGQVIIVPPPPPVITSLDPNPVPLPLNRPYVTLDVSGNNFVNGSVILWNGTSIAATYYSSSYLSANVLTNLIPSSGSAVSITVSNPPSAGSLVSPAEILFIGAKPAPPAITSLLPNPVPLPLPPNRPYVTIDVTGSSFVDGSVILWNGTNTISPTFYSSSYLSANVLTNLILSSGSSVSITVSNPPSAGGGVSSAMTLNIGTTPLTLTWGRSGNIITIGWPTNGFKLQSSPLLPASNWADVAGSETTNSVVVTIGATNQFYRLKQ